MKIKTANKIRKILELIESVDEESAELGISLFIDCFLVKNLSKHKKLSLICVIIVLLE